MKYITLADLTTAVRKNIWKIPHDIDFVIGIPRSGMLPATIIAEFINVPLIDLHSLCRGGIPSGGNRLSLVKKQTKDRMKVLVVDDTVFSGTSMKAARKVLEPLEEKIDLVYCAAFLEGPGENTIDIYLEDVRMYTNNYKDIVIYEYNIFHHYAPTSMCCMYDIDGVFCMDPPDERDEETYRDYIANAVPLFVPKVPIGKIVTYRLQKNEQITKDWLERHGIRYGKLIMFPAQTWEERNATGITPEQMKAEAYMNDDQSKLFIESNDWQARRIWEISKKPVLCVETNKLYGGE